MPKRSFGYWDMKESFGAGELVEERRVLSMVFFWVNTAAFQLKR